MHQVFHDLVENVSHLRVVNFLQLFFVLTFSKLFEFLTVFDQGYNCGLFFVLLDIWLFLEQEVSNKLVNLVIEFVMDSCLIQNVGGLTFIVILDSDFDKAKTWIKTVLFEDFLLMDIISGVQWVS